LLKQSHKKFLPLSPQNNARSCHIFEPANFDTTDGKTPPPPSPSAPESLMPIFGQPESPVSFFPVQPEGILATDFPLRTPHRMKSSYGVPSISDRCPRQNPHLKRGFVLPFENSFLSLRPGRRTSRRRPFFSHSDPQLEPGSLCHPMIMSNDISRYFCIVLYFAATLWSSFDLSAAC